MRPWVAESRQKAGTYHRSPRLQPICFVRTTCFRDAAYLVRLTTALSGNIVSGPLWSMRSHEVSLYEIERCLGEATRLAVGSIPSILKYNY